MSEQQSEMVKKSRKKRQQILQEVEEMLEWRHNLLEVNIAKLVDELAETREDAVAIEDVNQAFRALHGVTLVRKEKDQALFWLSRTHDFREFHAIQRVIDNLWKNEHFKARVLESIQRALKFPSFVTPREVPWCSSIDVTIDKLRELVASIMPFIDLRVLLGEPLPHDRDYEASSSGNAYLDDTSTIMHERESFKHDKSWLQDLERTWPQVRPFLMRESFPLSEVISMIRHPREGILVLQFLGLLIDVGVIHLDSQGQVSVTGNHSREFLRAISQNSQWNVETFIAALTAFVTASREELLSKDSLSVPRAVIISSRDLAT